MNFTRRKILKLTTVSVPGIVHALAPSAWAEGTGRKAEEIFEQEEGLSLVMALNKPAHNVNITPNPTSLRFQPELPENFFAAITSMFTPRWYREIEIRGLMRSDLTLPKPQAQIAYETEALDTKSIDEDIGWISVPWMIKNMIPGFPKFLDEFPSLLDPPTFNFPIAIDYNGNEKDYVKIEKFGRFKDTRGKTFFAWNIVCLAPGRGARMRIDGTLNILAMQVKDFTPVQNIICSDTTKGTTVTGMQDVSIKHIDGTDGGSYDPSTKIATLNRGKERNKFYLETTLLSGKEEKKPLPGGQVKVTLRTPTGGIDVKNKFADSHGKIRIPLTCAKDPSPSSTKYIASSGIIVENLYGSKLLYGAGDFSVAESVCIDAQLPGVDPMLYTEFISIDPIANSVFTSLDSRNHVLSMRVDAPVTNDKKWGARFNLSIGPDHYGGGYQPKNEVFAKVKWYKTGQLDQEETVTGVITDNSTVALDVVSPGAFTRGEVTFLDKNNQALVMYPIVLVPTDSPLPPQFASQAALTTYSALPVKTSDPYRDVYYHQKTVAADPQDAHREITTYRIFGLSEENPNYIGSPKNPTGCTWIIGVDFDFKDAAGKPVPAHTLIRAEYIGASETVPISMADPIINFNTNDEGKIKTLLDLKGPDIVSKILFKSFDDKTLAVIEVVDAPEKAPVINAINAVSKTPGVLAGSIVTTVVTKPVAIEYSVVGNNINPGKVNVTIKANQASLSQDYFKVDTTELDLTSGKAQLIISCMNPGKDQQIQIVSKDNKVISNITNVICT